MKQPTANSALRLLAILTVTTPTPAQDAPDGGPVYGLDFVVP